jgi:glycosyltransferase involved in cell wall biosynthesis
VTTQDEPSRQARAPAADPPAVAVIVPAFGVARFLGETLRSIQAQSFGDWEAIVVDDGDTEAAAVFAPFAADPRMRLLQTDNGGVSVARNRGLAASEARVIAFLDGDDIYEPAYLSQMLQALQADPALGFVACDARLFGPRRPRRKLYSDACPIAGPLTLERVLTRQANIFTAVMARREALESAGGFDPRLRAAEDLDLWIRLLALGWRAATVTVPLVRYRRRAGSLSASPRGLLSGACAAYAKAAVLLEGRPEAAAARAMARRCRRELAWADGEALLRGGRIAPGLALLSRAGARSPRWRLALALMRRAPWLAVPLLRLRRWLPEPRRA